MGATVVGSHAATVPRWIMPVPEDDADRRTFGQIIEAERLARGWSQEYVAATIGVRQGKISEYENDKVKDPPLAKVLALEQLYGRDQGELAAVLWGDRVRAEIRALMSRSSTFVLDPDAPPALYDVIEIIGTLDEDELEAQLAELRRSRRGPGESSPPPTITR